MWSVTDCPHAIQGFSRGSARSRTRPMAAFEEGDAIGVHLAHEPDLSGSTACAAALFIVRDLWVAWPARRGVRG